MSYDFTSYKQDARQRPSSKAWSSWAKFEKVGDMVQGVIRDVFYRPAKDEYKEARGITLEQPNGQLINVAIKRLSFVLEGTDGLRLGDPLTVVFEGEKPSSKKNYSPTKLFGYYGRNMPETEGNKTVAELDAIDRANGGMSGPEDDSFDKESEEMSNGASVPQQ